LKPATGLLNHADTTTLYQYMLFMFHLKTRWISRHAWDRTLLTSAVG